MIYRLNLNLFFIKINSTRLKLKLHGKPIRLKKKKIEKKDLHLVLYNKIYNH